MLVSLATDLLIGVGFGLILELWLHIKNGAPLQSLFRAVATEKRNGDELSLVVHDAAIFTNFLGLKKRLSKIPVGIKRVVLDFESAWVVDPAVPHKLHALARDSRDFDLVLTGLDNRSATSDHELAARRKHRQSVAA